MGSLTRLIERIGLIVRLIDQKKKRSFFSNWNRGNERKRLRRDIRSLARIPLLGIAKDCCNEHLIGLLNKNLALVGTRNKLSLVLQGLII